MIDMSAAFDVVDTEILFDKMKLYGIDRNAVQWTWSYLTYRSQCVYIEGSMSSPIPLEAGPLKLVSLGQYSTPSLPTSYLRLFMRPAALRGIQASSMLSVRNESIAMMMTHVVYKVVTQRSCHQS